jgi:hypothetical protein
LPASILRTAKNLGSNEQLELEADIRSTLDLIDPEFLDPAQAEVFQKQRYRVGEVLADVPLTDDSFVALAKSGSTVGYYLRARSLAPTKSEQGELANTEDVAAAMRATQYLWSVYEYISADPRCLVLLTSCEWVSMTSRWLFRGQRQPLPFREEDRLKVRRVLLDLLSSTTNEVQARYRYLDAVLNWLTTDEAGARQSFNALASETEYVERGRVINRHVITDERFQPVMFEGVIDRQLGDKRWSVFVEQLSKRVDFIENDRDPANVEIGRSLRNFAVAFNYLGPIVDSHSGGARRQ